MSKFDKIIENTARSIAQKSSRRGFLTRLGTFVAGAGMMPLLPVSRASATPPEPGGYPGIAAQSTGNPQDPGDPTSCDYWRYCAIDGFLCSCCGGSANSCPAGTEMSPITWIGTCQNPADGRAYIISYNDCCGAPECSNCLCNRNVSDRPISRSQSNNDTNWCLGTSNVSYSCSTALIVGVALEE